MDFDKCIFAYDVNYLSMKDTRNCTRKVNYAFLTKKKKVNSARRKV